MGAAQSGVQRIVALHFLAERLGHGKDVFVATPAHVHDHQVVFRQVWRDFRDVGEGMRRL